MNRYSCVFTSTCPNNSRLVEYHLTITAHRTIMVEDIVAACEEAKGGYHEDMADKLYVRFGGQQRMVAFHHGVWIETLRG